MMCTADEIRKFCEQNEVINCDYLDNEELILLARRLNIDVEPIINRHNQMLKNEGYPDGFHNLLVSKLAHNYCRFTTRTELLSLIEEAKK